MMKSTFGGLYRASTKRLRQNPGEKQETDIYFDPNFAAQLEIWGTDSAWQEIQFLLSNRSGRALDLACGTGRTFDFLKQFTQLDYFGCDIAQPLIDRAVERGIAAQRLQVADATKLGYQAGEFDYVFSIGSLEHFTEQGICSTISECNRVCNGINFHMVPVSQSGFNEGWISPLQGYWNNSEKWWLERFGAVFGQNVWVMTSKWFDRWSRGAWFICTSSS